MKKLALLFCYLTCLLHAYSQTSFVKTFGTLRDELPFCIKQIGSSYYMGVRSGPEQHSRWHKARLMKLSSKGDIQSELTFEAADSNYFDIHCIVPISGTEFLAIGGCKQKQFPHSQLWVMKMDTALNIIWDKKYFTNKMGNSSISVTQNPEGNYLIGATISTGPPNWNHSLMFLEISEDGDSLQANYFTNGIPLTTDIQSIIWINGQYKAFVSGFGAYTGNNSFTQILQIDANLNLLEVRPAPYFIQGYMNAKKMSDSLYYLAGMAYSSATHFDVAIAKLSNLENSLAYNHAGKPNDAVDYSGWLKCMSVANANSIYTGGTGNDNGQFYYCPVINKVLMLSNYDSLLNCRWTRFYGSDACYTFNTMDATSDGGCIIAGMYFDPANPGNLLDVIVVKVDSTGIFTNLPDNVTVSSRQAIVYPNPGRDYITVQSGPQIAGSVFMLYDASGCQVLESILINTMEQIDASSLPPGAYPWQIISRGKIIEQGKWIKQ